MTSASEKPNYLKFGQKIFGQTVRLGSKSRSDLDLAMRAFLPKFGYCVIAEIEHTKLEIDVERARRKRAVDS